MPRAENRKRLPNLPGNAGGGAKNNKTFGAQAGNASQNQQNKKQELVDKMRKLQASKTTQTDDSNS